MRVGRLGFSAFSAFAAFTAGVDWRVEFVGILVLEEVSEVVEVAAVRRICKDCFRVSMSVRRREI